MRVPLQQAIGKGAPLVSDGAIGTELQKAGLELGGCGDAWNLTRPESVLAIHRAYVAAGSQLLTTNTFGANRFVLANYGLESRVSEICRAGARLAREAISERGWVLGSVGPCGGFIQPDGEIAVADLEASLREQIGALLEAGVDAIIFETMTALNELEACLRIVRPMGVRCVIASAAFDRTRVGYRTMMGASPEQFARVAMAGGADVLGANCGKDLRPEDFAGIAQEYRTVSALPICVQPNGGQPRLAGESIVYPSSPEEFGAALLALSAHAQIVGGCCGAGPEHIAALTSRLQRSAH